MLSEFVDLKEGDWVIQNGANSAVRNQNLKKKEYRLILTMHRWAKQLSR